MVWDVALVVEGEEITAVVGGVVTAAEVDVAATEAAVEAMAMRL
jgi:hypothetical protein